MPQNLLSPVKGDPQLHTLGFAPKNPPHKQLRPIIFTSTASFSMVLLDASYSLKGQNDLEEGPCQCVKTIYFEMNIYGFLSSLEAFEPLQDSKTQRTIQDTSPHPQSKWLLTLWELGRVTNFPEEKHLEKPHPTSLKNGLRLRSVGSWEFKREKRSIRKEFAKLWVGVVLNGVSMLLSCCVRYFLLSSAGKCFLYSGF